MNHEDGTVVGEARPPPPHLLCCTCLRRCAVVWAVSFFLEKKSVVLTCSSGQVSHTVSVWFFWFIRVGTQHPPSKFIALLIAMGWIVSAI